MRIVFLLAAMLSVFAAQAREPAPRSDAPLSHTTDPSRPSETKPVSGVTVADLDRLLGVAEPAFSPDGAWVLYSLTGSHVEEDLTQTDLWRVRWEGGAPQQLTFTGTESEWSPRWSPRGDRIAFLSDRGREDGLAQVWVMAAFGGEARQVGEFRGGAEDFDWSPNGKSLVIVARDPELGEDEEVPANPKPIVTTRFQFKEDITGYLDARRVHLHLLDVATGKATSLTSGPWDDLLPSWSPDGTQIAFVSKRDGDPDRHFNTDIYLVAPEAGATARRLSTFPGADAAPDWLSRPRWSRDGLQLTYPQGGEDRWLFYAPWQMAVLDVASGATRIPAELDRNMTFPHFARDGRKAYALVEAARETQLHEIDLRRGGSRALTSGPRFLAELAVASNDRIVVTGGDEGMAYELLAFDRGQLRPLTAHNAWIDGRRLAAAEVIRARSSDEVEIEAFLLRPTDPALKPPYPTIVDLHGGPVYQFSHEFMLEWQAYAEAGFAVLAVNPRGSSGRGFEFARAIYADWGNKDVDDVRAAIDRAIELGVVDPHRIGAGGWSYGGILTNYLIAREPRIRAAVSGAGASHLTALYGHDQYAAWYEIEVGTPWANPKLYRKLSYPLFEADRIRAATLFQCAELDYNVPCQGAEQLYQALRSQGVPTQLVIYPGESHSLWVPSYARDRLQRSIDWFRAHLARPEDAPDDATRQTPDGATRPASQ